MERFKCIGKTDYKGRIQQLGAIITLPAKEAKLLKGHSCWEKQKSVTQINKEAEEARLLAEKEQEEADEANKTAIKEQEEADEAKLLADELANNKQ